MTCNNKCIHYPVCEQKNYDFANIEECPYYYDTPTVDTFTFDDMKKGINVGYKAGRLTEKWERPHGEWVDEGQYAEGHSEHAYFCKNCDYQIIEKPNMISENRFCKNCGADMRKGGAE